MSLRDITVFLDPSPASEKRLGLATRVARDHGACLNAVYVRRDQAVDEVPGVAVRRGLVAAGSPRSSTPQDGPEQRLRECLRWFGGDGNWYDIDHVGSTELRRFTRTADLIILGQVSREVRPGPPWQPDEILLDCGRPVLMVPYAGTFSELGRRVLVAWNGSREAARALNDALPMIRAATSVTVMTVRTRDEDLQRDREATQQVIRYLARHDIPARATTTRCAAATPYPMCCCQQQRILPRI